MVDWSRLLIRTDRPQTPERLGYWEWRVGRGMHPLVMTKFGDWFLADPSGRVHWLELIDGGFEPVADSVPEFERLVLEPEKLDDWFLAGWCDALHEAGVVPADDQCFGFKIPPRLGAPVTMANVEVANLQAYQLWMAHIHRIPPGTVVDRITVTGE